MPDIVIGHGSVFAPRPNLGRNAPLFVQPPPQPSIKHQIDTAQAEQFRAIDHVAAIDAAEAHRLKLVELREEAERATVALHEMHRAMGAVDDASHEPVPQPEDGATPKAGEHSEPVAE